MNEDDVDPCGSPIIDVEALSDDDDDLNVVNNQINAAVAAVKGEPVKTEVKQESEVIFSTKFIFMAF
jgi:hypothetical protein